MVTVTVAVAEMQALERHQESKTARRVLAEHQLCSPCTAVACIAVVACMPLAAAGPSVDRRSQRDTLEGTRPGTDSLDSPQDIRGSTHNPVDTSIPVGTDTAALAEVAAFAAVAEAEAAVAELALAAVPA